jgi:hypothetical protein
VAGGDIGDGDGSSNIAELFNPATGAFSATGNMTHGRDENTATLLRDGTVLFTGSHDFVQISGTGYDHLATAELYDPVTGTLRTTGSMSTGRELHAATLLNDGTVLITGSDQYIPTPLGGDGGRDHAGVNYGSKLRPLSWPKANATGRSSRGERFPKWVRSGQRKSSPRPAHRIDSERSDSFWSDCGLAVVTHTSAEYELRAGRVVRRNKAVATRGLNLNCNRRLKSVFISAATAGGVSHPWQPYLDNLERKGMRADMARLTWARKIAALALAIWKKGERFDPKKLNWTT